MSDNVIAFPTEEERAPVPEPDPTPDPSLDFEGWATDEVPRLVLAVQDLDSGDGPPQFWEHARQVRDIVNSWPIPEVGA